MGKLFVTVFAKPCSQDKSYQNVHPDTRICTQLKSYTVTNFWLRDNLYRDTAPVPPIKILYLDSLLAPIKIVPRSRQHSTKLCTMTAKTRAIPSLHRDYFLAKEHRTWPALASGNTTSPYCRAVISHSYRINNQLNRHFTDTIS